MKAFESAAEQWEGLQEHFSAASAKSSARSASDASRSQQLTAHGQHMEDVHVPLAVPQGSQPSAGMAATDGTWGRGEALSHNAVVVSAVISSPHSFMSLCMDKAEDVICPTSLAARERRMPNSGGGSFAVSRDTPAKNCLSDLLEVAL